MNKNLCGVAVIAFLILVFLVASSFAATKDPCAEEGIIVKNLTMLDLWYEKNSGECTIWVHDHILMIRPEDTVNIFSDLTRKTSYCKDTLEEVLCMHIGGNVNLVVL